MGISSSKLISIEKNKTFLENGAKFQKTVQMKTEKDDSNKKIEELETKLQGTEEARQKLQEELEGLKNETIAGAGGIDERIKELQDFDIATLKTEYGDKLANLPEVFIVHDCISPRWRLYTSS